MAYKLHKINADTNKLTFFFRWAEKVSSCKFIAQL